jgi:2-polyprenyl-3-methyl-5-hydroxy-6-metoxy-1,4-benzoquinol methylase
LSNVDLERTAARSVFFDQLAGTWSQTHYGPQGGMVARIARFAGALETLIAPNASVLDYGCGTGDIAVALAARGYQIEACDASAKMIEQARALHGGSGVRFSVIEPEMAARQRTSDVAASTLGMGHERFDAVICSSVLEYLNDLPTSLRALIAMLKPHGWVIATVPNVTHQLRRGEAWHRALMRNPLMRAFVRLTPKAESYELQWLSHNRLSIPQWAALLSEAGLQPVWQDCEDHPLAMLIGRRCR